MWRWPWRCRRWGGGRVCTHFVLIRRRMNKVEGGVPLWTTARRSWIGGSLTGLPPGGFGHRSPSTAHLLGREGFDLAALEDEMLARNPPTGMPIFRKAVGTHTRNMPALEISHRGVSINASPGVCTLPTVEKIGLES